MPQYSEFASLIVSVAAVLVSAVSFLLNYLSAARVASLGRKPVLVFEYDGASGWMIRNVGNGPAMNAIVAQRSKSGDWINPVRVPPLAKDGKMILKWLGHVNTTGLGATYVDTENRPYTSTCGNDLSRVEPGLRLGPWAEANIARHWANPQCIE